MSLCGHFLAISDLTLRHDGPLFFIIVSFSKVQIPQRPPGGTGFLLPIIFHVILGSGLRPFLHTKAARAVSLLLAWFLNDAVWLRYLVLKLREVLP